MEHEIAGEFLRITLHLPVEGFSWHAVEFCEIGVENYLLATNCVDYRSNNFNLIAHKFLAEPVTICDRIPF